MGGWGRWPGEVLLALSFSLSLPPFFLSVFLRPSCALLRRWGGGELGIPACRGRRRCWAGRGAAAGAPLPAAPPDCGRAPPRPPDAPASFPRDGSGGCRRSTAAAFALCPPLARAGCPVTWRGTLRRALPCPPLAFAEGGGGRSVPVPGCVPLLASPPAPKTKSRAGAATCDREAADLGWGNSRIFCFLLSLWMVLGSVKAPLGEARAGRGEAGRSWRAAAARRI